MVARPASAVLSDVLLVEPHADEREMYEAALTYLGFRVRTTADGVAAFTVALTEPPEAIVTELRLPDCDGAELCGRLRAHPVTSHLPVLILTAQAFERDKDRAEQAGCDLFLRKPCLPDVLAHELRRVVSVSRRLQRASGRRRPPLRMHVPEGDLLDRSRHLHERIRQALRADRRHA